LLEAGPMMEALAGGFLAFRAHRRAAGVAPAVLVEI
jgi:hypothetical protein